MKNMLERSQSKKLTKHTLIYLSNIVRKGAKNSLDDYHYSSVSNTNYHCRASFSFEEKVFHFVISRKKHMTFQLFVTHDDQRVQVASYNSSKNHAIQWSGLGLESPFIDMIAYFKSLTDVQIHDMTLNEELKLF